MQMLKFNNSKRAWALQILVTLASSLPAASAGLPSDPSTSTSIFKPLSTPADSIFGLSLFVLAITGIIFAIVAGLLVYSAVKFRRKRNDDGREPPQIYGSNQLELAWTVIPVLVVVVLFLTTARIIHSIQ